MRFVIDCEYNGVNGQLLSMALVPYVRGMALFYEELLIHEIMDEWTNKHVIPAMNYPTMDCRKVDRREFQNRLQTYLGNYSQVDITAGRPDDIRYLCEMMITGPGSRIDTPPITLEIRRDLTVRSRIPHNALADAMAICELIRIKQGR